MFSFYLYLLVLFLLCIFIIILAIACLMMILSVFIGVPFIPVKNKEARDMISYAEIKPGMKIVDLGSGAGQLLFLAAKQGAIATGYELNFVLCLWTKWKIFWRRLKTKVKVHCLSIYKADLHDTDVVFAYLMPGPMKKLANKLFNELPNKAKIISYAFSVPNHQPIQTIGKILIYEVRK